MCDTSIFEKEKEIRRFILDLEVQLIQAKEELKKLALKPCPHCGLTKSLFFKENEHSRYWAICCDASTKNNLGGCGSSSGFKETKLEALELWNRRA